MWLYLIVGFLLLVGIVGSALGGGIFTTALIPLAVVILAAGLLFGMAARRAKATASAGAETRPQKPAPLPHTRNGESEDAPTSPEALSDARRRQQ